MPEMLTTLADQVQPAGTALLVIDTQNDFLHPEGSAARRRGLTIESCDEAVRSINKLIERARDTGVQVIYVRVVHSPGTTLPNKRVFRPGTTDLWPTEGTWGAEWYERLTPPRDGDIVVTKYNYDCFRDTPLALHLEALGIHTVVLTGFATEVCVETTARRAFVEGYYVVLPQDCTGGFGEASYRASLDVLGRFFGTVTTSVELLDLWRRVPSPERLPKAAVPGTRGG